MKSGISLVEMAQEIQRQNDLKADYMLDTRESPVGAFWWRAVSQRLRPIR